MSLFASKSYRYWYMVSSLGCVVSRMCLISTLSMANSACLGNTGSGLTKGAGVVDSTVHTRGSPFQSGGSVTGGSCARHLQMHSTSKPSTAYCFIFNSK